MTHAIICIPELRHRRMRGDAMTNFDSNPYSPPTDDQHAKPGTTHYEFQFTAKGIRGRTGLQLPKNCLVTGSTDDLMPYPVRLMWMPLFSRVIVWGVPLFFLIGTSDNLKLFQEIEWFRIAWSSVLAIAMFGPMMMTQNGVINTYVSDAVCRGLRKRIWTAAIAALAGVGVGSVLSLLVLQARSESNPMAILIVASVMAALFACGWHWIYSKKSRTDLWGTKLRVVSYQSGQFEITGFAPQYLDALRKHRSESDL